MAALNKQVGTSGSLGHAKTSVELAEDWVRRYESLLERIGNLRDERAAQLADLLKDGKLDQAAHVIELMKAEMTAASGDLAEAYYQQGQIKLLKFDSAEALKAFRRACDIGVRPIYCLSFGNSLVQAGDLKPAVDAYRRAGDIAQDDKDVSNLHVVAQAYNNLGVVLHKNRQYEEAEAVLQRAHQIYTSLALVDESKYVPLLARNFK